jgi:hypothetical protein
MHILLAITQMHCSRNEGNEFFDCISMVDEAWIHLFEPQMKQENAKWHILSPQKKLAWCRLGAPKVMDVMCYSQNRLLLDHPVPVYTMVNGQCYCSTLAR